MATGNYGPVEQVFAHLKSTGDKKFGHGWKAMVNRRLDRSTGYVTRDMAQKTMRLATLFDVLEILGEEPGAFFAEAFGTGEPLRFEPDLAIPAPQDPRLAEVLTSLTFDEQTASPNFDSPVLEGIIESKKTRPEIALDMVCSALVLVANGSLPRNLTFPLLLEWSEIRTRLNHLPQARSCLQVAFETAHKVGAELVVAEIKLRLSTLLVRETANPELALRTVDNALLAFVDLKHKRGVGQALVKRSWYQHQLGLCRQAIASLNLALEILPEEDRFVPSARHTLGLLFYETSDFETAVQHLEIAEEHAEGNPELQGNIAWTLAGIARKRGQIEAAEASYELARSLLLPIAPVQASLVSLDLARLLLENGDPSRARNVTVGLSTLLDPLRAYPEVQAIVLGLLRVTLSTRLDEVLLSKASADIKEGVAHQAKLG